jgi:phosphomevalonate kinase
VIARSPGKLVLTGAYAVLEGAPAIVAAVDRYVVADSARSPEVVTEEVAAAIEAGALHRAPWFDASALRVTLPEGGSRKLGLGSSAAILVASLGAAGGAAPSTERELREAVFPLALAAHRAAQGGGSGIDVAASVFGSVLRAQRRADGLDVAPHDLPRGLVIEAFRSDVSAVTRGLVAQVRALREQDPRRYSDLLGAVGEASEQALAAASAEAFVAAVDRQALTLGALGDAASVPILTASFPALRAAARREGGALCPSGAGGGDVSYFAGFAPSSARFRDEARALGMEKIDLEVGARGLHLDVG